MRTNEEGKDPKTAAAAAATPATAGLRRRLVTFGLAILALGFVAYVVPIRDRCFDTGLAPEGTAPAAASKGPRFPVSRDANGCTLQAPRGPVRLSPEACARLDCEPGLASTLAGARLGLLALLAAVYGLGTLAWAARWHALLRLANAPVTVRHAWRVTLEAQAAGVLLPGGVAGDAVRIASLTGLGVPTATVAASVLLDRAIGLSTMAGMAAALAAVFEPSAVGPAVLILGAIPVAVALGLAVLRSKPMRGAKILEHRLLARTAKPVLEYLNDPRAPAALLRALAWSLVVSAVQLGVIRGLVSALDVTPTVERWVYAGAAIAFIAGAIPALPGGWGTSDAAFVVFLARAGVSAPAALSVSLLYRLYWYSASVTGALLFLGRSRGKKAAPSQ